MADDEVNQVAVAHVRDLIDEHQYVLDSVWGDVQPDPAAENAYLERHSWAGHAGCHLGRTVGANDETTARHEDVELAAHELLQHLDVTSGTS